MTSYTPYLRDALLVIEGEGRRTEIRDLFVRFGLRWESSGTGAAGDIEVYNLADSTESRIRRRGDRVALYAGYRGAALAQIAYGDVRRVERRRSAADRITVIRFGGSVTRTTAAIFDRAYDGVVSVRTVVEDVIATMEDVAVGDLSAIPVSATIRGRSFALPSTRALTGLLLPYDLAWHEEDGAISVSARGGGRVASSLSGLVISERSGMVGTPTIADDGIRVRTLLDHRVHLGMRFVVRSSGLTAPGQGNAAHETAVEVGGGAYHVVSYEHHGDTRGGGWFTDIEGRAVGVG